MNDIHGENEDDAFSGELAAEEPPGDKRSQKQTKNLSRT
jgi:hypothetical protein